MFIDRGVPPCVDHGDTADSSRVQNTASRFYLTKLWIAEFGLPASAGIRAALN